MRILRFVFSYVLLNIFGLLAAAFLAQNVRTDQLAFFGLDFSLNFVWILLGSAAFGFLLAFFLLIPGRVAAGIHVCNVDRDADELEKQVAWLQQQREELFDRLDSLMTGQERTLLRYQRLLADHSLAVAERDRAVAKLAGQGATSSGPASLEVVATPGPQSREPRGEAPLRVELPYALASAQD
ncbi:MAG: hypothetical protein ACLQUY_23200 [Ktedonobacterales bacterium]